jgi:uncharacterized protein (TIGR02391 family)
MTLIKLFPDPEVLCALEPDELGLRILPVLAHWQGSLSLAGVLERWIGGRYPGEYTGTARMGVELAIREAWAWLIGSALLVATTEYMENNGLCGLSRRAQNLAKEPDSVRAFSTRRIPKEALHPSIREDVWSLYHRSKYDLAVLAITKAVEVAVRELSNLPGALVGVKLMRAAFAPAPNHGPLTDIGSEGGEQVARMELFAGVIGSYKNPQSHRHVDLDDPDEAAEIIMLANHLLRIVDGRKVTRP